MTTAQTLTVDVWSDVICPWCWIGLTRFEKALAGFEHRDRVKVVHHAYRLMPGAKPRPVRDVIAGRMNVSPSQVPAVLKQVEDVAASEGLTYRLADTSTGDTLDAHRLIKLAETKGFGHAMLVRLYRAYLSEVISVFDAESLAALAAEVGLDADEARAVIADRAYQAEIDEDQRQLQSLGGSGVPFFVIGGKLAVSGGQPSEVFARALTQGWASLPVPPVVFNEGAVCGPDGCEAP